MGKRPRTNTGCARRPPSVYSKAHGGGALCWGPWVGGRSVRPRSRARARTGYSGVRVRRPESKSTGGGPAGLSRFVRFPRNDGGVRGRVRVSGDGRQGARGQRRIMRRVWGVCGLLGATGRVRDHHLHPRGPAQLACGKSADSAVYTASEVYVFSRSTPAAGAGGRGLIIFNVGVCLCRYEHVVVGGPEAARPTVPECRGDASPTSPTVSRVTGSGSPLSFCPSWAPWQLESRRQRLASSPLASAQSTQGTSQRRPLSPGWRPTRASPFFARDCSTVARSIGPSSSQISFRRGGWGHRVRDVGSPEPTSSSRFRKMSGR